MSAKAKTPLCEAQLMCRVRDRFPLTKGWATFTGIRNHRGFAPPKGEKTRTLDGMAVGLWQSLKAEVLGFECKSTRGDFLREVADPSKSDAFYPHCNRFWLVIGDPSVASPDEVPMGWGLLVPRGRGLVEKVRATRKKTSGLPQGIVLSMLASSCEAETDKLDAARREERQKVCAEYESGEAVEGKLADLKSEVARLRRAEEWNAKQFERVEQERDDLQEALRTMASLPELRASDIVRAHELNRNLQGWNGGLSEIRALLKALDRVKRSLGSVADVLSSMEGER